MYYINYLTKHKMSTIYLNITNNWLYLIYRVIVQLIRGAQHTKYTTHFKHIFKIQNIFENFLNTDDFRNLYVWYKDPKDVHVKEAQTMIRMDRNMSARL
jgi:hypothetical protein